MKNGKEEWLIGKENVKVHPISPYSEIVIQFLDELSAKLRLRPANRYTDLNALAFWCRKGNILKLKEHAEDVTNRLGRGLIFHITPSNVPVNFAFSYFFGLLSGNANIVRIPSKDYPQIQIICEVVKELFEKPEYIIIKEGTAFVRYGHDKEITDRLSLAADGRIIWGGDRTIMEIRQSPVKPKCVEIVFADRYSMGIFNSRAIWEASDEELKKLARGFYNDTYLMDQNACSTPHLLLWMGEQTEEAKKKFWDAVFLEAKRYDLEPIKVVDKYTDLCMAAMSGEFRIQKTEKWDNLLYTLDLEELPEDISKLRGRFGMFYQYTLQDIQLLAPYINERMQTMLYYGLNREELLAFVKQNHLKGIDRIVTFGNSLNMNPYWDGYDIIGQLSRKIVFE